MEEKIAPSQSFHAQKESEENARSEYMKSARIITDAIDEIPYKFPDGPELPEWRHDFRNRVDTHGIKFSKDEPLQTQYVSVCVPVIVRCGDISGLLHVAGGEISDLTVPRRDGTEIVQLQLTDLKEFFERNPSARAMVVRSNRSNDWIQVLDQLRSLKIPLDGIVDMNFEKRVNYDVAYRPTENQILVKNPSVSRVMVFPGFSEV